uniref:CSON015593 protein n=1 Tax=Culicoides sonorensis TaxID=179676 RepID=A0A336LP15_CULSO
MKYLSALLCLSIVATVAAGFGHYVPKGYYTIDEEGNQSPVVFIESIPELFHRSRRQVQGFPNFPAFPFPSGFPQNFGFVPVGNVNNPNNPNLNNRFGETNGAAAGVGNVGNNNAGPFGPGFGFAGFQPLQFPIGVPGSNFQGTSISSVVSSNPSGGVGQRFGEENTSGQTVVTTVNKDGKVTETITHIRPDGSTHTTQNKGNQKG